MGKEQEKKRYSIIVIYDKYRIRVTNCDMIDLLTFYEDEEKYVRLLLVNKFKHPKID